jgi:hypothetical protein
MLDTDTKRRNKTAHPNGNIFFSTQAALDAKITETLRVMDEIQTRDKPFDFTPFDLTQGLRQGNESFDYAVRP